MASPKLEKGYLVFDPNKTYGYENIVSTIGGVFKFGKSLKKFLKVEGVVEGSVAVDGEGKRLAKCGGYEDQEISNQLEKKR